MTNDPVALRWSEWADEPSVWNGTVDGKKTGTDLTIIFYSTDEIGAGPRLHVHSYDEVFIVRKGRAVFTVGDQKIEAEAGDILDQKIEAEAGDILMGPAHVPHKFKNLGPGPLETTDIHLSPEFIQTLVDDPDPD